MVDTKPKAIAASQCQTALNRRRQSSQATTPAQAGISTGQSPSEAARARAESAIG